MALNPRRSLTRVRHSLPFTGTPTGTKPLGYVRRECHTRNHNCRVAYQQRLRQVVEQARATALSADVPLGLIAALEGMLP